MFLATNLRRYLTLMQARGFEPAAVLAGSRIAAADLQDPACVVDGAQVQAVVQNMLRLTGDPGLGLKIGAATLIPELGIIGHALMSSRTMRELVTIWIEYSASLVGAAVSPQLDELEPDGAWSLTVPDLPAPDAVRAFHVEEFFTTGVIVGEQIAGRPFTVNRIEVSYPAPPHAADYERTFGHPVLFGAPLTRIVLGGPALSAPLRNNDELFLEICVRHCQQVLRQLAVRNPMVARLKSAFLREPGQLPSMAQAARRLGMSARTLRRRLEEEGTTYNALVDDFRRDMAIEYLRSGHMAPKEIAYVLGFSSPSTFRRAFKVWTDRTVGEYADELRPAPRPLVRGGDRGSSGATG